MGSIPRPGIKIPHTSQKKKKKSQVQATLGSYRNHLLGDWKSPSVDTIFDRICEVAEDGGSITCDFKALGSSVWEKGWLLRVNEVLVAQSCPTLCNPMSCSQPGSSVHGISQARILEWVAISFSKRSSWPRDWTQVSYIAGRFFLIWATREAPRVNPALWNQVEWPASRGQPSNATVSAICAWVCHTQRLWASAFSVPLASGLIARLPGSLFSHCSWWLMFLSIASCFRIPLLVSPDA